MSSMWQDYRAGKRTEIDALNGVVVRIGRQNGIPTPVNATLYAAASLMEHRRDTASGS
jgi:2-dehydropantoate 2-reductase